LPFFPLTYLEFLVPPNILIASGTSDSALYQIQLTTVMQIMNLAAWIASRQTSYYAFQLGIKFRWGAEFGLHANVNVSLGHTRICFFSKKNR
jgi:hypothetical protein